MNNKCNTIAGEIRALKVGEAARLVDKKLSVVQSTAYRMAKDLRRRYVVCLGDEPDEPIYVTRVS